MHPASQSDGPSTAITQTLTTKFAAGFISQFGGHHHPDDQYEDNAERQQGPQHLISLFRPVSHHTLGQRGKRT
jgi:hypothetical protein